MKMIQSILIIFLFGCFGTVTNAELCTDCAKFILETEYKPKDWPVLEPRPKVVGGPRTITKDDGKTLQQWDIEHGGFRYKACLDYEIKDKVPVENLLSWLAPVPILYRKGFEIVSEEGKNGVEFLWNIGGGGYGWEGYLLMNLGHDLNALDASINRKDENQFMGILTHEIGHVFNGRWGPGENKAGSTHEKAIAQWKEARSADPHPVSPYGNSNPYEDMAEYSNVYAYAKYMHGDNTEALKRLREITPNRFVLWEKILNSCRKCPPNRTGPNCEIDNNSNTNEIDNNSNTNEIDQRREAKQKRNRRGGTRKNRNKIGQETNYGSGINGKRIRGRSRNNFDEMENEFQLPTSGSDSDITDAEKQLLDMLFHNRRSEELSLYDGYDQDREKHLDYFSSLPVKASTDLLQVGKSYLFFSYAAYCDVRRVENWSCKWCRKLPRVNIVRVVKNSIAGTQVYIGYYSNKILVAFRGSTNIQNWAQNIAFPVQQLPWRFARRGAKVHTGFLKSYESLRRNVWNALIAAQGACKDCEIVVTGHSLGGAQAVLAALDFTLNGKKVSSIYTFGCPRVGDPVFSKWWNSIVAPNNAHRFVHKNDLIPHLPPSNMVVQKAFWHAGKEVWETKFPGFTRLCGYGENPTCSFKIPFNRGVITDHVKYFGVQGVDLLNPCR